MHVFFFLMALMWAASAFAQTQSLVTISSRGQTINAVLVTPMGTPIGAVILLAGDNGRLDITANPAAEGGFEIGRLTNNQLVRTRVRYAEAGFLTLVPDLAPDLKVGATDVIPNYRIEQPHADDIGAMATYLRSFLPGWLPFLRGPVVVIGTSKGSIGAANAIVRLWFFNRPNRLVVTSPFLLPRGGLSVKEAAGDDTTKLAVPMLAVSHSADMCAFTPPSDLPAFMKWYRGSGRELSVEILGLGGPFTGDVCDADHAHGFQGLDRLVVWKITTWIMLLNLPTL
jgi:hypothetical protein